MDAADTLRSHQDPQPPSSTDSHPSFDTVLLREQIVTVLREAVLSGELEAGRLYSARSLAAELGVSLTPVRGAVLQLVRAGLMEQHRNKGFRVCCYSAADRAHLAGLLLLLEREAIGAFDPGAAQPADALERSAAAGLAAAAAGDLAAFLDAEEEFHHALCLGTGNAALVETALDLRDRLRLHDLAHVPSVAELTARATEHRVLLQLLRRRQWEPARRALERHLRGEEQADAVGA